MGAARFLLGVMLLAGVPSSPGAEHGVHRATGRVEPSTATVLAASIRSEAPVAEPTVVEREVAEPPPVEPAVAEPPPVERPAAAVGATCADALAYLREHQAPGFVDTCEPGSALGHYGFTCWNVAPHCPNGERVIHIACPAPFVYKNEAHNSWTLTGGATGIDPFGQGSSIEQAYCNALR